MTTSSKFDFHYYAHCRERKKKQYTNQPNQSSQTSSRVRDFRANVCVCDLKRLNCNMRVCECGCVARTYTLMHFHVCLYVLWSYHSSIVLIFQSYTQEFLLLFISLSYRPENFETENKTTRINVT